VCYKPDMRKWMRERLKRRKKQGEQAATEAPPPLQPTFYDTQPQAEPPEVVEPEPAPTTPVQERPTPGQPQRSGEVRRRRRRGGRGRGGSAVSGQPTKAASKAPAATGTDTAEPGAPMEVALPEQSDGVASEVVAPQPPPVSRGTVVLAVGLPGSGKSSWFKRHSVSPLSSDLLRLLLFDDAGEQRFQDLIFSNLRSMLRARLIARRPMNYVDATNLTAHDRQGWIKLAKDYGYDVQAVFFDVPLEVCLERNRKRDRLVPEDAMRRMAGKLKPPRFEEGFSKITVVRVKRKTVDG
jgi:predicted kinase